MGVNKENGRMVGICGVDGEERKGGGKGICGILNGWLKCRIRRGVEKVDAVAR